LLCGLLVLCSVTGSRTCRPATAADVFLSSGLSVCRPVVSWFAHRPCPCSPLGSNGHPVRWRRWSSSHGKFNDRIMGSVEACADLHPQRADVGRCRAALPSAALCHVDDKLHILTAMKKIWGERFNDCLAPPGHYALNPKTLAAYPPADLTIEGIGDLVNHDLTALLGANAVVAQHFGLSLNTLCQQPGTNRPSRI